jgi:hypothetical protein
MCKALGDLPVLLDVDEVLRTRDEREVPRVPVRRLACLDERQSIARGIELPEVLDRLVVGGELVVVSGFEPERRFRSGYRRRLGKERDE